MQDTEGYICFLTIGNLESSITANINVTCTNNTQVFVAWNAAGRAGGALVNLGYACYWAENNTNVSCIITNNNCQ